MSEKIVQLNEEVIKGQLKESVRGRIEETLNELLEAEAEKVPRRPGTSAMSSARATAAATTTATSLLLPGISPSRCPNSRVSPLRPPLLSGIPAGRAVWKRPSLRCTLLAYPSSTWRTLPRLSGVARSLPPPSVSRTRKRMSTLKIGGTVLCRADVIRMSMWMGWDLSAPQLGWRI